MPTKWETFKKSLSDLRSKMKTGSSGNFNQEVKRMGETAKKNGDILDNEYRINYNKLKTFGKDIRIIKVEKYITEHKKNFHEIREINEYFNFFKGKPYNEYVEDKFGGLAMKEFLRETVSSPIQFAKLVSNDIPKETTERTKITMDFWKYMDKCASRMQKKVIEMAEFKSKVEELLKTSILKINQLEKQKQKQKQKSIQGKVDVHAPGLIKELSENFKKRK